MAFSETIAKHHDSKLTNERSRRRNQSKMRWFIMYFISILIIGIVVTVIFYPRSAKKKDNVANPNVETKKKVISTKTTTTTNTDVGVKNEPSTQEFTTQTTTQEKEPEPEKNVIKITYEPFSVIVDQFESLINHSLQMTYNEDEYKSDSAFNDTLADFIDSKSPELKPFILNIRLKTDDTYETISNERHNENKIFAYYKILFKYFEVLYSTYKIYTSDDLKLFLEMANFKSENSDNTKFIFQQLFLKIQIDILIQMNSMFAEEIKTHIIKDKITNGLITVGKKVWSVFYEVNRLLFEENIKTLNFEDRLNDIEIKYMIKNLDSCRKFIISNFYLVYLSIFEVADDFSVQKIDGQCEEKIEELKTGSKHPEIENDEIDWRTSILDTCKNVLQEIGVLDMSNLDEFMEGFDERSGLCLEEINNLVATF